MEKSPARRVRTSCGRSGDRRVYDSPPEHNEAHVELLGPDGREYDKQWLGIHMPYNAALTRAADELSQNYG
jgi:hypothetical protein